jgi:uncharacterized protein (TIGR03067 family)
VVVVLVGLAIWYFVFHEPEPRNDAERFVGEWKLTHRLPGEPDTDEGPVSVAVRVTGDRWQMLVGGREGKAFRLTLDESTNPKGIELELLDTTGLRGRTPKLHGVYAFEGNRKVRVRVRVVTQPRPKFLDDSNATDWLLSRVRLEPTPQPNP